MSKTVNFNSLQRYYISLPRLKNPIDYDGTEKIPEWYNYEPDKMTISGTTSATEKGMYTTTFTPKAGYVWTDNNSSAPKTITWELGHIPKTWYIESYKPTTSQMGVGDKLNVNYTGAAVSITLPAGKYRLECWGAQGGSYSSFNGGYGGYAVGDLTLTASTNVFVVVGGQPSSNGTMPAVTSGGYNGGGAGCNRQWSGTQTFGQGGGGGTDIRIGQNSLYARVIVAGGGGGSASADALTTKCGGGTSGSSPISGYAGGATGAGSGGSFGQGGAASTGGQNYMHGSGGGGGGWYGGGAYSSYADNNESLRNYNGGGSGYVYTSSTASQYPSGCLLNSSYYLTNAYNVGANSGAHLAPNGNTSLGRTGHGFARITVLSLD